MSFRTLIEKFTITPDSPTSPMLPRISRIDQDVEPHDDVEHHNQTNSEMHIM